MLCVAVTATACISSAWGIELGQSLGPVNLIALTGEPLVMDNYIERPATAVLFLSARCETTERSIAEINRIYRKYRLRNALFVGDPREFFPPPKASMKAVRLATCCTLLTVKTGSAMKRSTESTAPS